MPDIADHVDPLVAAIYAAYEKANVEEQRPYIGASVIGKPCERALWYAFRWCAAESFSGRMLRLFQTGHLEEPRMVADLRAIGADVHEVDPATGKQFGFVGHGGHARGHMDGAATNVPGGGAQWHVLEFKTHSAKSFAELGKNGVQKAKPEHYAQMTWYMGKAGLARALYLAKNKDTDELYSERIQFDQVAFEKIEAKFERVIFAPEPPSKISEDPKFYLCNWCSASAVCHGNRVPPVSCRTCVHSTPEHEGDGRWSCALVGKDSAIPIAVQRTGCPSHLPLPFLVTYADAVDAGDGWIEFRRKDNGALFCVGNQPNAYSTHELSAAKDHRCVAEQGVEYLRSTFGGVIVG